MWAALGQRAPGGSPGSAGLVRHLEEYAATLARNMELTYLNPVGLVTPNISEWWMGEEKGRGALGLLLLLGHNTTPAPGAL